MSRTTCPFCNKIISRGTQDRFRYKIPPAHVAEYEVGVYEAHKSCYRRAAGVTILSADGTPYKKVERTVMDVFPSSKAWRSSKK
jgi:hypothetical protein